MNFHFLTITKSASSELRSILNNNVIGTPGHGMLYQHLQADDKLKRIEDPYFVNLEKSNQVVGTCCFCKRATLNNGEKIKSFYVRYFSFRDIFRRKIISERRNNGSGALRKEINLLLSGEGLDVGRDEKFFHYAYVDPRNKRSTVLCKEFGFETVRQYTTIVFSRMFPSKSSSNKIEEVQAESVQGLLESCYRGFNTLSFENLSGRKYYFIKDDKGERIAGVQVNPDQWKIHSLPGIISHTLLSLFTKIPILNRLISKNFRFLTLEGIYVSHGNEHDLEKLFESLLVKYKVYSAICVVDTESKMYPILKSLRLGLMSKLNKEVRGNVICRFENFSVEEKRAFKKIPVYISGIDAT